MGYEDEMYEYHDDLHQRRLNKTFLSFRRKNIVSCHNISFRMIIWEYICWILAGKPNKEID
jgi:hypothetical protein